MNDDGRAVRLTGDELDLLVNALNTICNGGHAIPEWEFQTLIGFSRAEAQSLLDKIAGL